MYHHVRHVKRGRGRAAARFIGCKDLGCAIVEGYSVSADPSAGPSLFDGLLHIHHGMIGPKKPGVDRVGAPAAHEGRRSRDLDRAV